MLPKEPLGMKVGEFDVGADVLDRDLEELVTSLTERGLVRAG